jgi:hypothetical protein
MGGSRTLVSHDPEPPTRRLPPQQPGPGRPPEQAPGGVHEREYVEEEAPPPGEDLRDRLRSLQTALAVVGVIALAALGLSLYTLLSDDEEGDGRANASQQRVSNLEDRVDRLEDRVGNRATENSVSELRSEQQELATQVEQLSEQAGGSDAGDQAQQAVGDLQSDLNQLERRVDQLAENQGSGEQP